MTDQNYPDSESFTNDLSEYLKEGDMETWDRLIEEYPFKIQEDGRYVFLPRESPEVDLGQNVDFLVAPPNIEQHRENIYEDVAEYLKTDDAVEKLIKLAEMQDHYDHTVTDEGKVIFGSTPETGIEVGAPALSELAEAYNNAEGTPLEEFDKEMLGEIASKTSTTIGTIDTTVYVQNNEVYVERDTEEGTEFAELDAVGEEISLEEAINIYKMLNESASPESGKEYFENMDKIFRVSITNREKLFMDLENDQVVHLDFDTLDLSQMSLEEAKKVLDGTKTGEGLEAVRDFYQSLER